MLAQTNNKTTAHTKMKEREHMPEPTNNKTKLTPAKEAEHMPIPTNNKTIAHSGERT